MTLVGIDYSLTCPAVCVSNSKSFSDNYFYFLDNRQKYHGQALTEHGDPYNILGDPHDEYLCDQQRYENIASWVMNIVSALPQDNLHILIEDYAFAAKGRVFNLAENCGLLKYLLYKNGYKFHTIAPSVIKKYATGKGNANKELMYAAFHEQTGVDLLTVWGGMPGRRVDSPVADIVDAYYLTRWMWDSLEQKEAEKMDRGTNRPKGSKRSDSQL